MDRSFVWGRGLEQFGSLPSSEWQPEAWDSSMFVRGIVVCAAERACAGHTITYNVHMYV